MTDTLPARDAPPPASESPVKQARKPWLSALLLRLHFYAGILVGPFILVAALSGAMYAATPQLEQAIYSHELHVPVAEASVPLADQILAAQGVVGDDGSLVAVRPAPNNGDTTRVMFTDDGLGESETRAIFVNPANAEIRGDLTAYGTSGALPLRTWIDQFHRSLHLGEFGRLYSELAASWLGVVVIAGALLWIFRIRRARAKKDLVRPDSKVKGYRRIFSWHASTGIWLLVGALFLSATGITWSQYAGHNVSNLRAALNVGTPALSTDLIESTDTATGDHSGHSVDQASTEAIKPATFDAVLAVAQRVNVNTGFVEISPPSSAGQAWVVQEIQHSFPTEVDAIAINGQTLLTTDRVDFADFNLTAKLARWGIDTHTGSMFGLFNQIVLIITALGIAAMVTWGYLMWWKRRPTRGFAQAAPAGALVRTPRWGTATIVAAAVALGLFFPMLGVSLIAFSVVDGLLTLRRGDRRAESDGVDGHSQSAFPPRRAAEHIT
ncbi:PepSY domain-containing protein [Cryobacterium sp. TMT3-29-2]|uniref:PepSY-associated TM helix domain-containing protein n=1 Tax=Cryobacterium sp. TMT3-29-2 TaxID=2555867 RepID=UPI0010744475|nr:PepSY-associated TM helix domain-containing protein [Cryobacterium sp. TMT3-29-2]TFC83020.1 PepSY domain-containing protein [Cryobacterium sp. TMT3-29-2]